MQTGRFVLLQYQPVVVYQQIGNRAKAVVLWALKMPNEQRPQHYYQPNQIPAGMREFGDRFINP